MRIHDRAGSSGARHHSQPAYAAGPRIRMIVTTTAVRMVAFLLPAFYSTHAPSPTAFLGAVTKEGGSGRRAGGGLAALQSPASRMCDGRCAFNSQARMR